MRPNSKFLITLDPYWY